MVSKTLAIMTERQSLFPSSRFGGYLVTVSQEGAWLPSWNGGNLVCFDLTCLHLAEEGSLPRFQGGAH